MTRHISRRAAALALLSRPNSSIPAIPHIQRFSARVDDVALDAGDAVCAPLVSSSNNGVTENSLAAFINASRWRHSKKPELSSIRPAIRNRGWPCHATSVPPIAIRCTSFSLSMQQYNTLASEDHGPKFHFLSPEAESRAKKNAWLSS